MQKHGLHRCRIRQGNGLYRCRIRQGLLYPKSYKFLNAIGVLFFGFFSAQLDTYIVIACEGLVGIDLSCAKHRWYFIGPRFVRPHSKEKNASLLVAFFDKHGYCYVDIIRQGYIIFWFEKLIFLTLRMIAWENSSSQIPPPSQPQPLPIVKHNIYIQPHPLFSSWNAHIFTVAIFPPTDFCRQV